MIVPTVIAIAAPTAVRITHWIASPRSGSSPRTRAYHASHSATPTASSGNTAATALSAVRVRWVIGCLLSLGWSGGEHLRHRRIAEKDHETEAEHDLGDEHRLGSFVRAALHVGQFAVTERRRL